MTRAAFSPVKPRTLGTVKGAISELVNQHGGVEQVMATLDDIGKSEVYAWTDPQSDKQITFARVVSLTNPDCTAGVEFLAARAGGMFVPMPSDKTPIGSLTAESVRRHGQAAAELIKSLADGTLSPGEAAKALPDLGGALRALALLHSTVNDVATTPPDGRRGVERQLIAKQ